MSRDLTAGSIEGTNKCHVTRWVLRLWTSVEVISMEVSMVRVRRLDAS